MACQSGWTGIEDLRVEAAHSGLIAGGETPTAADLAGRQFRREVRDQLWVTGITEHPTREGKVYCAVVLDVYSAASSAGSSTPPRPRAWSPAPWTWPSATALGRLAWSFTPATGRSSPPGPYPARGPRGWSRPRALSATAATIFHYLESFHNRRRRRSALGMLTLIEYEVLADRAESVA
jgi:transposase InsO family protein